jgi:GR25 family glycosyltransferase involved in LPS biosynthesis
LNIPAPAQTSQRINPSSVRAWDFFDRIYCISLANRPDRQEHARGQFERVGLLDRVEFVIVDKHPTDSEHGIFESHLECLRKGLAAGSQNIVVFEDDILFLRFSPKLLDRAITFMKTNADWDMFFFGCFVYSSRKTSFPSILQVQYRCTAHAYVVNRSFAQRIVGQSWRGIAYDDALRSITHHQAYAVYPSFAFQSGSATDNSKLRTIDRIRRMIGGVRVLQRWNEFSSRHWPAIIMNHIVIALILILLFAKSRHGLHFSLPIFHRH